MTLLSLLLIAKITLTLVAVIAPFLFAPRAILEALTNMTAENTVFFRLYGIAILALIVAYGWGLWSLSQGVFPWGVVLMGIVSNIGATLMIFTTGAIHRDVMKVAAAFFGFIGAGLLVAALLPTQFAAPLF